MAVLRAAADIGLAVRRARSTEGLLEAGPFAERRAHWVPSARVHNSLATAGRRRDSWPDTSSGYWRW